MSVQDLVISVVSTGETIYDPLTLATSTSKVLRVTNFGVEDLQDLGMWVVPATNVGDVDNPADFPPETDYQDLMTWGQAVVSGVDPQGGLKLTLPQNDATSDTNYITREQGSLKSNKLSFKDLPSGGFADFTVELETPPGVASRRLFIDLVLE